MGGALSAVVVWLAWRAARVIFSGAPLDPFPPGWIFLVATVLAFVLTAWLLGSVAIYVYTALAGGVTRRDERERSGGR